VESGWQPANNIEREMMVALQAGDSGQYARLLTSAPLFVPELPDGAELPAGLPVPDGSAHVVVFTSAMSLYWTLGGLASGHEEATLASLRERHLDPGSQLVINPGLPIGVLLSLAEVDDVASGAQSLVPVQDVQDAVVDGVLAEVRRMVLAELGGDEDAAANYADSANDLEAKLRAAVAELDFDAFLLALIASDVTILTDQSAAEPPWLVIGGVESPVIPVFSSPEILTRITSVVPPHMTVPFLDVITNWPSEEHVLCFNPGTSTELTLPGGSVPELAAAVASTD
jgi:hypothetical protein